MKHKSENHLLNPANNKLHVPDGELPLAVQDPTASMSDQNYKGQNMNDY